MGFDEVNCFLANWIVVWPKASFQCKDCKTLDLQIIPSPAISIHLYILRNILGFYHKTKLINTYKKYTHNFDTILIP